MEKDNLKNKKKKVLCNTLKNIKLQDAGIKPKKHRRSMSIDGEQRVHYPTLYLNVKEVPQLKGYEVGDKVMIVAEAEIISHSKNDNMMSSRESFDLKLKKIGCQEKNKKEDTKD